MSDDSADAARITWDFWAGGLAAAPVTAVGHKCLSWAVGILRNTFGEDWLRRNAETSGTVPFIHLDWFPLTNHRVVVRVIELAAQIELVRREDGMDALLQDAALIRPTSHAVLRDFQHLLLELEVAAFAILHGWTVCHEKQLPTGRKPDLWLSRNGIDYLVEVTALGFDREFQTVEAWTDTVFAAFRGLERRHRVETASCLDELLDNEDTADWLARAEDAALLTAEDGLHRTVQSASCTVTIAPEGQLPEVRWTGPMHTQDVWARVATRLQEKAKQTRGGPPAWLRLDDVGALFKLTDWSARPLAQRLEQLADNIAISLAQAPHVRGVILTGATQYAADGAVGETAWAKSGHLVGIPDHVPSRERLADGPAGLRRIIPGNRQRLSFVIPTRHSHIQLPPGTGLEPGLWYHNEPTWLDRALTRIGQPQLRDVLP